MSMLSGESGVVRSMTPPLECRATSERTIGDGIVRRSRTCETGRRERPRRGPG